MKRLYETHLPVADLERSLRFYDEVIGLEHAFSQPERNVAFLWVGGREGGMLGLWGPGSAYGPAPDRQALKHHFAIQVELADLLALPAQLARRGAATRQFGGAAASEPSVIGWMPSAQVYLDDPDGHSVEFLAILDAEPHPKFFGTWSEWQKLGGGPNR